MKKSEGQLRMMIDKISTLAWSCRPDGTAEFLNQRWLDYTGLSLEEALGWGWKVAIYPEDQEKLMATWLGLLTSGEPGEEEARLRRFDGEYRWFLFRAVPVRDGQGKVVRWYGTNTDIEDRKRAESLLCAEKLTLEMIAGRASLTDILENLCSTIDAQAPNTITTVLLMDPDGERLWPAAGPRVPSGWSQAITPLTIGPSVGSCGTAAFLKKPVITEDIASDPLWADYRDVALSHGLRASWSQPLISKNNEVLGTFAMYYPEPRSPSRSDLQLIEEAAHITLIAIERCRTEEALRRSEAYLAEAQRLSHTGSFGWNVSNGQIYWSQETFRIFEYEPAAKVAIDLVVQRTHSEERSAVRQIIDRVSREKKDFDFEHRLLMPDGSIKYLRVVGHPSKGESGSFEFVGAVTDITERKQAEADLQKALDEIKKLRDRLYKENIALREEIDKASMFEDIVGESPALQAVLERVAKVAPTDSTVLITGETGTGKELIARAIHKRSRRSSRAFVTVNCAATPATLIASELFGHEKGAFTGALQRRLGRFELAEGGTIFLDEIGELPAETQIALLAFCKSGNSSALAEASRFTRTCG